MRFPGGLKVRLPPHECGGFCRQTNSPFFTRTELPLPELAWR